MVLSKSLILRFFCRFVGKNVTKFLCYIDLLKVTKLTRLVLGQEWEEGIYFSGFIVRFLHKMVVGGINFCLVFGMGRP